MALPSESTSTLSQVNVSNVGFSEVIATCTRWTAGGDCNSGTTEEASLGEVPVGVGEMLVGEVVVFVAEVLSGSSMMDRLVVMLLA